METKTCQNCKKNFTIEPDDFSFYEKIKVPPPTFCPECRAIRRMAGANERVLYKRKCDLTGETIFSMYPEVTNFPVYEVSLWYGDKWDSYQYGVDYDFSKTFFSQFQELFNKVPRMSLVRQGNSINSEYTHRVNDMKNSFMVFRGNKSIDSMYTYTANDILNCVDNFSLNFSELCYECIDCNKCYKTLFSQESNECRDSMFLYSCRNCSDCIGCVNLINKQYCIFNQQLSKEDYVKTKKELKLNSTSGLAEMNKKFDLFRKEFPQKSIMSLKSEKVSGNWFLNCKNVTKSFSSSNSKDCRYIYFAFDIEDCLDYFQWGGSSELIYDSANCGINCSKIKFSSQCWIGAHDLEYCDSCPGSSNCFGCIGLKKGEYCILNKQYSKEEYFEMVEKIKKQMNEVIYIDNVGNRYKYGEFFPVDISPFSYNETAAQEYFPLTKEEAIKKGYKWKEKEKRSYNTTIDSILLPETISEVDDSILNQVISCAEKDELYSTGAYKINQDELNFYRRMDLPLPRVCFDVRHRRRSIKRPPLQLIKRNCSKCNIEVDTAYTKEYAPILYCEKCYQLEVY